MRFRAKFALALAAVLLNPLATLEAAGKLSGDLVKSLEASAKRVKIIVRAKPGSLAPAEVRNFRHDATSYAYTPDAMVALRKKQATDSRKALEAFLRTGGGAQSQAGGEGAARNIKDLWIVNAFAAEITPEMVRKLERRDDVEAVYLDRYVKFVHAPAEPAEEPERPAAKAWGVTKIGADKVWKKFKVKGAGAVIGHIDTGADGAHPALKGRILHFKDFTKAAKEAPYDDEGHGTHTAGSIVGQTSKIGVAPAAKLVVAKALDGNGSGELSWLLAAMQWMLDPDGKARPIAVSNSWGADRDALGEQAGVFRDAVKAWADAGIVPLFSSGNSGPDTEGIPGAYPESIAVGATDSKDAIADFSSGATSQWDGQSYIRPDVSAPGVDVYSAAPGGKYVKMDGTSMACPHIAGVVALMKSARASITAAEIGKILLDACKDLGPAGKDTRFGFGRIDAYKAVQKARTGSVAAVR